MARSIWKGIVSFGLVSIPVRLFSATEDKDVSFHLLHQPDHSRIRFKRFCSSEDVEVEQDDLVRAYEVGPDHYVEITDEDLEQLPLPARHIIELSAFVKLDEIDPIYFEKSYYLEPDETGLKPYALLTTVLNKKAVAGVATIAIRNKEQLCTLRVQDDTLLLETLRYPDEIRERDKMPSVAVSEREVTVAGTLVEALAERFDPSKYHDHYREALLQLIENKTQGREVVAPEGAPAAPVTDLMAALRASLEAAKERKGKTAVKESSKKPRRGSRKKAA